LKISLCTLAKDLRISAEVLDDAEVAFLKRPCAERAELRDSMSQVVERELG
jgi:hypothetical protein